jgi:autotransporter-associated beta strand protein
MLSSRLTTYCLRRSACALLLPVLAVFMAFPSCGLAASRFWDGSSDGNFATAANWVGGVAPVAGDDLVFQAGITRLLVTNNFSPNRAFNTILFQGSNYFVRGNAILVTNGISSINPSGANHIDADVDVRRSQPWEASGSLGVLDINGDINLNTNTLTVRANTGDFFFSGIISGTGNLVKTNVGTLQMNGLGSNTYSGFTRLDGGILELAKTGYISIAGDLTIGDGNGLVGTDVLRLISGEQIANTSDVTVKNSGLFDLNDFSEHIGALTMQGGTIDSGTGLLFLGGNLTTLADVNTATINGRLSLGGASRVFAVSGGTASPDLRINASISADTSLFASAGITKNGNGALTLAGTNTYNGSTIIDNGSVTVLTDRALGSAVTPLGFPAGTTINGNGFLWIQNVQITNENLTVDTFTNSVHLQTSGTCIWTGDILLNSDLIVAATGGTLLLNGQISGVGGISTALTTGAITLGGTNANTYTGTTWVRDGTLLLAKDSAVVTGGAMSGALVIGEEELPANTDVVRSLACCQLPEGTSVTVNSSGLFDVNGFSEAVGGIVFNGGDIDAPSPGDIRATSTITVNRNTNSQAIISGRMRILGNQIIDVTGHNFSPDLRIDATILDSGGLTKNGPGEVSLNASNTFTGTVIVNDGFLEVDDSFALGSTAGRTVVNAGAVLLVRFNSHIPLEPLFLNGSGQSIFGALSSSFGSNSWAGNIVLNGDTTIFVDTGDYLNLRGSISDVTGADVTKTGAGTLIYSGSTANSYDDTFVFAGTLELAKTISNSSIPGALQIGDGTGGVNADVVRLTAAISQIGNADAITITNSGLLDINNVFETVNGVQGTGRIDLGTGTLQVDIENDLIYNGFIFGAGQLQKNGNGNWTITGNNTYTGDTTVIGDGSLIVNGSQPQSDVFLLDDANLGGDGVVGSIDSMGVVSPGPYLPAPAILTCSNVFLGTQEFFNVDIAGPAPGSGYDQLNVRGTNHITGANLSVRVAPGFAPLEGQEFVILNNDGAEAIVGTFNGLPNNSIFTANGLKFRIRYSDAFGNDIVLTVTNVATRVVSAVVSGGNGNGTVDFNECNFINVVITNTAGNVLSNVTATLVPKTPGVAVTYGTSAYPTMMINARGTNVTPFQFSTSPGFVSGTNIQFELIVKTLTNGTFSVPFSIPTGSPGLAVPFSRNGDQAIPDLGTLNSTISLAGLTSSIARITVSLHLSHTSDADLDISLIGPDGTIIDLSSDNGGTFDDYGLDCTQRTTFSDAAATLITAASAPFSGTFRPEQALSNFVGKVGSQANGTWTLRIADDTAGGLGTLHCWSLFIAQAVGVDGNGQCESCPDNRTISGFLGTGSLIQSNRLFRDASLHVCDEVRSFPGLSGGAAARFYDAFVFENGESNACITATLISDNLFFGAIYTNSYNPANLSQNYMTDMGSSPLPGLPASCGFNVQPRGRFIVVVHSVNEGDTGDYTLQVTGGSCRPVLKIDSLGANRVALDWSTAAIGYNLLQTNRLPALVNPNWIPVTPAPVIVNSRFRVTNTMNPSNAFYELRKP